MMKSRVLELNASDERGIGVTATLCDVTYSSTIQGHIDCKYSLKVYLFGPLNLSFP